MTGRDIAVLLLAAAQVTCLSRSEPPGPVERLRLLPPDPEPGFARVLQERPFSLPADHGPHLDYQTEWWYYTGNLEDATGAHFGYQLTFFRRGLSPGPPPEGGSLATNQVFFAHLALTDVGGRRHLFEERFSRGAAGLAGATGAPFGVWLEGWRVDSRNDDGSAVVLTAPGQDLSLELRLEAEKPLVAHGYRGVSRKSQEPGNASFYLSYTRLATEGTIRIGKDRHPVQGESWFDHEWGSSALGASAVGWDWFSLQLGDRRELMVFQIRREDGGLELASSGTLVEADGSVQRLRLSDVDLAATTRWTSPQSGAEYPARWYLAVPSAEIDLQIEPWLDAQELRSSFTYWEGAVKVRGTSRGQPVEGNGYVELTGYAQSMQGVF
jgi:predicted secreted hydrolase